MAENIVNRLTVGDMQMEAVVRPGGRLVLYVYEFDRLLFCCGIEQAKVFADFVRSTPNG